MLIILETGLAEARSRNFATVIVPPNDFHRDLWFTSLDPAQTVAAVRNAMASINSYTRSRIREESFARYVFPPTPIAETE